MIVFIKITNILLGMSSEIDDSLEEAVDHLEEIGFEPEIPHRISELSINPRNLDMENIPTGQFIVTTDSIAINTSKETRANVMDPSTDLAHELIHYNATKDSFGATSNEFKKEVSELMDAREAVAVLANDMGYDEVRDPELGKDQSLNPLHLEPIALSTEDIGALSEILARNTDKDQLPLEQISQEADGIVREHYPNVLQRQQDVYNSGELPMQEPLAYFVQLQLSGEIDNAVRFKQTDHLKKGFEDAIGKDFNRKPERYFGGYNRQEVIGVVSDAFGEMVDTYETFIYDGLSSENAAKQTIEEYVDLN